MVEFVELNLLPLDVKLLSSSMEREIEHLIDKFIEEKTKIGWFRLARPARGGEHIPYRDTPVLVRKWLKDGTPQYDVALVDLSTE